MRTVLAPYFAKWRMLLAAKVRDPLRIVVLVMDDAAAMRRAAGGIEIEPHRPQHLDHGLCEMRGPQHVAAEIKEQVLRFGRRRGPINVRFFARHELKVRQGIDFAEVFRERELFHGRSTSLGEAMPEGIVSLPFARDPGASPPAFRLSLSICRFSLASNQHRGRRAPEMSRGPAIAALSQIVTPTGRNQIMKREKANPKTG